MMLERFRIILPDTLKHEGGYVDHPRDPGGATMKGVTIGTFRRFFGRSKTKQDLRNITNAELETVYRQGYWNTVRAGRMWPGLDRCAFDAAVNSGPSRSLRWIQKAVGVRADGKWGPQTSAAIQNADRRVQVVQRACQARMGFLHGLKHWDAFGRGWSRRVAGVEAKATQEAGMGPLQRRETVRKARKASRDQMGGAAGSGGATGTLWGVDVPMEALIPVAAIVAVAVFILIQKARHNRNRAAAYEALNEESSND